MENPNLRNERKTFSIPPVPETQLLSENLLYKNFKTNFKCLWLTDRFY